MPSMGSPTIQGTIETIEKTYRNFRDAQVLEVLAGPRREVTLIVRPLVWCGSRGALDAAIAIRFGGISDFQHIVAQFREIPGLQSEIGFLGLNSAPKSSNANGYAFLFQAERRDFEFCFRCSNVTIESAGEPR